MANTYNTPGVYVEEISKFPPSVAGVATAIPAFIGYTEKADDMNVPVRITSLLGYEAIFGKGPELSVNADKSIKNIQYVLYDSMRLFYDNGGGICYVVSVGQYDKKQPEKSEVECFKEGIAVLEKVDEVTLLLFPDAVNIEGDENGALLGSVQNAALKHCQKMGDRFAILDVKKISPENDIKLFRNNISSNAEELRYGAAYYPYLSTIYTKSWSFKDVKIYLNNFEEALKLMEGKPKENLEILLSDIESIKSGDFFEQYLTDDDKKIIDGITLTELEEKDATDEEKAELTAKKKEVKKKELLDEKKAEKKAELKAENKLRINSIIPFIPGYNDALKELNAKVTLIPPSGAMAGIYSSTDQYKGVWKAPANVSIASLSGVSDFITSQGQENMNVDSNAGKSVNAIRVFAGKGIIVWGARTLDGNSNEWRYISVRRLFNYIEESVQKSTSWAVFSSNDGNTWIKIKSQIENFLNNLWRSGALAGSTPESSYFVNVGLGITMTDDDIKNGLLIIDIGLAAVRPAEFIVLRFSHKVQE